MRGSESSKSGFGMERVPELKSGLWGNDLTLTRTLAGALERSDLQGE